MVGTAPPITIDVIAPSEQGDIINSATVDAVNKGPSILRTTARHPLSRR